MKRSRSESKYPKNTGKRRKSREDLDHHHHHQLVEICLKEDGFLGSYYEAEVVSKVGKNKVWVEYKRLVSEADERRPLREIVETENVRPVPPVVPVTAFDVLDKVDAFDNDGWWVGRISAASEDGNYFVYFESSGDEIAYPLHRLRVHQEWEDGKWLLLL